MSNPFYIFLSSGLTDKTKLSFTSSNSSFSECVRNRTVLFYSSSIFSNEEYTDNYNSRTDISQTSTFTSCTFNSKGSSGGAIWFHGTSSTLTVLDSTFNKCNSTSGHGGAIYAYSCGRISVYHSTFIQCAALSLYSGGGILTDGASLSSEISQSTFISCSGGQDGGGLEIVGSTESSEQENLPVKDCKLIGCIANGRTDTTANDADGGGLIFWRNQNTIGIYNSLFSKCESKKRGGGSFVVINKPSFSNVIRFCFYCENTAPDGRNALIHFNATNWTPWNIVFFHSFTSDSSYVKSLAQNRPEATAVNDNLLPKPNSIIQLSSTIIILDTIYGTFY